MVFDRDYFGHEENVRVLSRELPAVSLFLGPKSVGKWELAEWLRGYHRVGRADVLRIRRLTQDNAKFMARWSLSAPQGRYRLVICRLDKATKTALNTVLKSLEEAETTRFILLSEKDTLPTIRSRSQVFEFGLLSGENVSKILQTRKNFREESADKRAAVSGGRIDPALGFEDAIDAKVVVLKGLAAVASKNAKELEQVAPRWTEEHTELLIAWCYESITGKWKYFSEDETTIRGTSIPVRILMALNDSIRPRLVVRAALAGVM